MTTAPKLINSLQPKLIVPDYKKKAASTVQTLYRVAGTMLAYEETSRPKINKQSGEVEGHDISICLLGSFRIIRTEDNAQFVASEAYLPKTCTKMVVAQFKQSNQQPITFGFEIGTEPSAEDSMVKYNWTAKPLGAVVDDSAVLELLFQGNDSQRLEAPPAQNKTAKGAK
jgi:hypothetical protein